MSDSYEKIENKKSLSYLIKLNDQLQSAINFNLEFSINQHLDFINYFEFNGFICKYFTYNFITDNLIQFNLNDRFSFSVNEEGDIIESHNKKLTDFFAQKKLVSKLNNHILTLFDRFCDDYILFFKENFKKHFYEKYIIGLNDIDSEDFSFNYKPKFFIRKKVNRRDVVKRYRRGEGKSYTHHFTFEFVFDILDDSIVEDIKYKKCQELLLNNTLEVVDDSDNDCDSFSTIYDSVELFSGQIDYSLTNQVNQYLQNGNLLEDPYLKYSSVEFKESNYKFQEQKLKALYFLLFCDIDSLIEQSFKKNNLKIPFVEYLFYCYNFYIDNKNKIDYRYYNKSFSYDFTRFKFFEKFNKDINDFMEKDLPQDVLSSFRDIFLQLRIESEKEELDKKVDVLFLKFLRYTFHNKL